MRAIWKNTIIAESELTVEIEGNHYFPPTSLKWEFLQPSARQSFCPWKGEASYYSVKVGLFENKDAAWTYSNSLEQAKPFEGFVAFWKGVQVVHSHPSPVHE